MSLLARIVFPAVLGLGIAVVSAAEPPKDSPFGQAGTTTTAPGGVDTLQFSGVSTVGKKTMINLYDSQDKRSFWVEAGQTSDGVTVVKYDGDHDQVTIRRNGTEKILPLRPPSAVVNGTAAVPATPTPAMAPAAATPTTSLSQARQEEEARMLVSDLLEIGMAQRKAYEEAQRRAAAGQNPPAQPAPAAATPAPAATPAEAAPAPQPVTTTTPSS